MGFGEGFYMSLVFLGTFLVIACVAMMTGNEVAKTLTGGMMGIVGSIAAFWFATRGQTSASIRE